MASASRKRKQDIFRDMSEEEKERIKKSCEEMRERMPKTDEEWLAFYKSNFCKRLEDASASGSRENLRFVIEETPWSTRGPSCIGSACNKQIEHGDPRIAVHPGEHWSGTPDKYHVACFEKLADWEDRKFLERLHPSGQNERFGLNAGAENLILEFKARMLRLQNTRDEIDDDVSSTPSWKNTLSEVTPKALQTRPGVYLLPPTRLSRASTESDGPDDKNEWNLYDEYFPVAFDKVEHLCQPDPLSSMLGSWRSDISVVYADHERLSEEGIALSEVSLQKLSELSND